jgi:molecular chaperone GrpE
MEENEQLEKIKSGNEPAVEEAEFSGDREPAAPRPEASRELTLEQTEDLKSKAAKADEHWSRLLRLTADFDNFKKRTARERQEAIKLANQSLLEKLILVLDNFDMAVAAANNSQAGNVDSLRAGIGLIYTQLKNVLTEAGLEEIDAAGKPFDPNLHEAVSQQETADAPEGHVLQQLRKGYKLRERLIRPAGVVVSKKPSA